MRYIDDQAVAARVGLIVDKLWPQFDRAMEYAKANLADADDAEFAMWINGAIFGIVDGFVCSAVPGSTVDEAARLAAGVYEMIDEMWGDDVTAGDINAALRRLVPDAFSGEPAA